MSGDCFVPSGQDGSTSVYLGIDGFFRKMYLVMLVQSLGNMNPSANKLLVGFTLKLMTCLQSSAN